MNKVISMSMSLAMLAATIALPALAENQTTVPSVVPAQTDFSTAGSGKRHGKRGGKKSGKQRGGGHFGKLQAILTPAQQDQFKAIMQESRTEAQPMFEKMKSLRAQLKGGSTMDDKTKSEFVALRKQMKEHRTGIQAKLLALLTPEQKAEFEKSGGFSSGERGGKWRSKRGSTEAPVATPVTQ